MNETEFAKAYLQYEENIKKVLNSKKIYDEDLLHDTYIDLYEWTQDNTVDNFVNVFVEFFQKRYNWREKNESQLESYDNEHLAALEIIDESDWRARERRGQLADAILEYVDNVTFPNERKPELNRKVLHLWLGGMTYEEIGAEIGMDANSVLHVAQRMLKIIRKNIKNMPKVENECHVGHPII